MLGFTPCIVSVYQVDGQEVPFEVMALRTLANVPGIIQLLDTDRSREAYCMVFERVVGMTSVDEYLDDPARTSGLRVDVAKFIFRQVLSIVARIHERGLEHKDVTPGNVLIHPSTLRVLIIDFGLSDFHRPGQDGKGLVLYFI